MTRIHGGERMKLSELSTWRTMSMCSIRRLLSYYIKAWSWECLALDSVVAAESDSVLHARSQYTVKLRHRQRHLSMHSRLEMK